MLELLELGDVLGQRPQFFLTGLTDGTGDETTNQRLRPQRAEDLRQRLIALGVPRTVLLVRSGAPATAGSAIDPRQRAVVIGVSGQQAGATTP
ncbi:MAG: hypothetical protein AAFU65_10995 [Pseudomonadota bacterium]